MTDSQNELREWTLPAGSLVKVDGMPFVLATDTVVRGAMEPQRVVTQTRVGEMRETPHG